VLLVLILRGIGDQHVIDISITEIQVSENLIDELLKCLRGVSEPEGHTREFEKSKGRDEGCFCYVVRMNWTLMVCLYRIYNGEDPPASKFLSNVGNVWNGMLVGDGPSFQYTIVATGSPAVFFLGDEVEGRSTGAARTPSGAVSEHLLELGFRDSEALCWWPSRARNYRWSRRGANVMDCIIPGFPWNTSRTDNIRKILDRGVIARAPGEDFDLANVRSLRGFIYHEASDVDEVSVSYVDE
jgi:hypothetical protein